MTLTPLQEAQNSITLQVSTNLSPSQEQGSSIPTVQSSVTLASNATNTTTISGSPGTKIYVHQNSSPMHSVITFENGKPNNNINNNNNNTNSNKSNNTEKVEEKPIVNKSKLLHEQIKVERPSSLYSGPKGVSIGNKPTTICQESSDKENKPKLQRQDAEDAGNNKNNKLAASNNKLNNSQARLVDYLDNSSAINNCSRKLSLSLSKDALSYRNLLRPDGSKNNLAVTSNPPSPTKSYDNFGGSFNNVYIEKQQLQKQQQQGSEPSLLDCKTTVGSGMYSYPSLSDLQVQFTSLAAQKILKGCPLNSVDTLVEVNMAAAEKPNNRELTVHTDFGLVWKKYVGLKVFFFPYV